ncbi:TonB-dependent receptor [Derxia gummosa]|uniref:TonB-dependent receptor n=1 Tax=Derxia gummosa DSM 723 TaxID=1121388 RepID=A0A8B6X436_9BURK|nr:TonB-dependent receptor [Derxia gummosa]
MKPTRIALAVTLACPLASLAQTADPSAPATDRAPATPTGPVAHDSHATAADTPVRHLGIVTVRSARPSSLPTQIPTTTEGVTREDIERSVNATDAEDALKYFPSLLVRKRYIGDYNHAILSSRASGTGNSARSAVYADGILLSNWLGNGVGGLSFPPRWSMVTPEEIERVDVMYGPFSAAYPGNSADAVVDYVTRMPEKFEVHAKVGYVVQPFDLYNAHGTHRAKQASASIGSREGDFAWWINLNRTESEGQPLTFANRLASNGSAGATGTPVTGAVAGRNSAGQSWYLIGAGTQYDTTQDHLKIKLAYDFTPTLRASYLIGVWRNESDGNSTSWLRDASGNAVYSGPISIGNTTFSGNQALGAGDFAATREKLLHLMHGLTLKSHTGGEWDWETAASLYDYQRDDKRQNGAPQPAALNGGAGTLADGSGTGWNTLAAKGSWRPFGQGGEHVLDFGAQQDSYRLRYRTTRLANNWLTEDEGTLASAVRGNTRLQSVWAQDVWRFADDWVFVPGLRAEHWEATEGRTDFSATSGTDRPSRRENHLSPKAALSWQWLPDTLLRASLGRAVRNPTVAELYGATSSTNSQYINDPSLRPERSWTTELSAEQDLGAATARLTFFAENTRDAIYSQSTYDSTANSFITRVTNVKRIETRGIEAALTSRDWLTRGLDVNGSLTFTNSKIRENDGYIATPGDTLGKWQPNIPRWRATALASYRFTEQWSGTVAGRYSGRQYRTLNNADTNGDAYMGVSRYATVDLRAVYRVNRQWTAAVGIDNVNNDKYWNFHPYPQRSYVAELKFDL